MSDLAPVYAALRAILALYAPHLVVKRDDGVEYYLESAQIAKNQKPAFFGAAQVKKGFVSYHLMPVYTNPELLENVSPLLKARMQGKSCFNFRKADGPLLEELAELTGRAYAVFKSQGRT